ncbi:forkhead domain-containing protein [Colletotrichum sojae]|uniref:Forkhead domain-containing protein n=1 Tax=Colletotrichum sojae TaxID=2175907 RepID=A0A8H6IX22_9PEZI|nr:forkhead domain-containing protein [Colletotrichum sojae]
MDVHAHQMSHSRAGTTTRSPEPMSVKTDVDNDNNNYYMIPGQQKLPVLQQQQQAPSPFYPSPLSAVSSQQQQFHSPTMSQIWASPRSSVDEFDNYSYSHHQGPAPTSYHAASMSPRTWSSSVQTPPSQFETPFHHQEEEYDGLAGGEPMVSPEGLTNQHPEPFMGYGVPCYQSAAAPSASGSQCAGHAGSSSQDSVTMRYDSPPVVVVETTSGAPVFTGSPAPMEQQQHQQDDCGELKTSPIPSARGGVVAVVEPAPTAIEQQQQQPPPEGSRDNGDPYAQLIWKALRARDNRAMTLQQLYQWFLDNTDKPAKAGNGGWRNSIRHNLSMNEAFCKREQTITDAYRSAAAPTTNERKPTEWFLRPEFEDRVMPTTHYRDVPRNSGRRNKSASAAGGAGAAAAAGRNRRVYHSSPDFPSRSVPARALSGRRGGRATTRSRNAARNLRLRPDEPSLMQWNTGFAAQQQHNLEAFRQLPYTTQSDFDRMQRNQAASARFRARAEAVRREQQQELQQQQQHAAAASPGIVPHQYFSGYPMDVAAGVYHQHHQHHQQQQQPEPHQIQPHADNSSVFYGWGGTGNHGL